MGGVSEAVGHRSQRLEDGLFHFCLEPARYSEGGILGHDHNFYDHIVIF